MAALPHLALRCQLWVGAPWLVPSFLTAGTLGNLQWGRMAAGWVAGLACRRAGVGQDRMAAHELELKPASGGGVLPTVLVAPADVFLLLRQAQ